VPLIIITMRIIRIEGLEPAAAPAIARPVSFFLIE
jgi:hypothetical protein